MPNWVMNELTCVFQTPDEFISFKNRANIEGLYASFFPRPTILDKTTSPNRDPQSFIKSVNDRNNTNFLTLEGIALAGDAWNADIAKGLIANIEAFKATGYHDWYSWNIGNWGVKWDACKCSIKETSEPNTIIFEFDSPWSTPEHFVVELSKLYPNASFHMVSGSIENDMHYEFTCEDGKFEETCSYESFADAVKDGKWGGWSEWEHLLEESEMV